MSIWSKVRANIRSGIRWAFSSYERPKSRKSEASAIIRRKIKPETVTKRVRSRTEKGRYKGDDKSTPDVDEAWTTVEIPVRGVNKIKK
jgi:hypothetical protein